MSTQWRTIRYMRTTSYPGLRRNLSATIDGVAEDHAPVLIVRSGGKRTVVLRSLEDFASDEEMRCLLRSPGNSRRLLKAVEELEAGKGEERSRMECTSSSMIRHGTTVSTGKSMIGSCCCG